VYIDVDSVDRMWYSMYYSMNDIKEQLTNSGIMMQQGEIIATDVMIEHNLLSNEIRYSYSNENGERWGTMNFSSHITPMFDSNNRIMGLLTNKPDPSHESYIFWSNDNS
jgi:hypothetical protein